MNNWKGARMESFNQVLNLGNYLLASMFVFLIIAWHKKRPEGLVHVLLSSVFAWIVSGFLKEIIPSPRPFEMNGLMPAGYFLQSGSFPSSHATVAFALGVSAYMHDGWVGMIMLLGGFAVGASRIMGNVHYPIDVVGGAVLGSGISYLVFRFHLPRRVLRRRR